MNMVIIMAIIMIMIIIMTISSIDIEVVRTVFIFISFYEEILSILKTNKNTSSNFHQKK